ncbi:MAG: 2Fe-2S iron-sulfur cluster-binding protein [Deltaproteobacteria bacterium]|jgi:NADH dehydrogenase/NADH:ubiquinone oxidoreductase subunit G
MSAKQAKDIKEDKKARDNGLISFKINGRVVQGREGWTILETARQYGFNIPTLCFHPAVKAIGSCRLCVVEVCQNQQARVVASCVTPVQAGVEVLTDSEEVRNVRRWVLEMLLANCPASRQIRELAKEHGVTSTRFKVEHPEDACVRCGLCVRACDQVVGVRAISLGNRGIYKEVTAPYHQRSTDCIRCGTCLYVCPTGAMEQLFAQVSAA